MWKRQIWVSEPHFGKVRGDARPWLMACWKACGDFLFAIIELFSLSVRPAVPELWGEMCTARRFSQGLDLFAVKFYLDRVVPSSHSWNHKKTRDTGLSDGEDLILSFDTILECDGQTDRRTDGRICHSMHSAYKNLKITLNKNNTDCHNHPIGWKAQLALKCLFLSTFFGRRFWPVN